MNDYDLSIDLAPNQTNREILENLLNYGILNEEMLDDMVNAVKQEHKRKRRGE